MKNLISQNFIEEAYREQHKLVAEKIKTRGIGGYKAAVSAKKGQQNLGLSTLISGVLYADGVIANNSTIKLSDFKLAKIETEIGYRLKQDITSKTTVEDIKTMVDEIMPVYEIPDITEDNPAEMEITKVIACNGFSSHYLIGTALDATKINPNECIAKLYLNDELINTGNATDAMDNQWEALSVAINLNIEHGYSPKKGDLIITGALGNILVMEKGVYTADYGPLGKLKLIAE